jgi:hypothetical protein
MGYMVSGLKVALAQSTSNVCWATVYTMMISWKDRQTYDPLDALAIVGSNYVDLYKKNSWLPTAEFGAFITAAQMKVEPMQNKTFAQWETLLRRYGLLWVGTLAATSGPDLHSRIVSAISGDGKSADSKLGIIDPAGGKKYAERFSVFEKKYEGAIRSVNGAYFQIRHF